MAAMMKKEKKEEMKETRRERLMRIYVVCGAGGKKRGWYAKSYITKTSDSGQVNIRYCIAYVIEHKWCV